MRFLFVIFVLGACSIERDVPGFQYPVETANARGDFPRLKPVHEIARADTTIIAQTERDASDLLARARSLAGRAVRAPRARISPQRITSLRARAAALRAAEI